jgi:hypothetical protein
MSAWRTAGSGATRPRRGFDLVFGSATLSTQACGYREEWRATGLSDHAAIVADFDLRAALAMDDEQALEHLRAFAAEAFDALEKARAASVRVDDLIWWWWRD